MIKNYFILSEVYKKVTKRKSLETFDVETKEKKVKYEIDVKKEKEIEKSLTDNLPIRGVHFSDKTAEKNPEVFNSTEVSSHTNQELEEIERRIRAVKNHLGTTVEDVEQSYSNGKVYIFLNFTQRLDCLRGLFCECIKFFIEESLLAFL